MASKINTAEGGTSDAAVTTANSGGASGDAFSLVSAGSGGSITFSTAAAKRGLLGVRFSQPTAGNTCIADIEDDASANGAWSVGCWWRCGTLPTAADSNIFPTWRAINNGVGLGGVQMNASGQIRLTLGGSNGVYSTGALAANTRYWIEVTGQGSGQGSGQAAATVRAYNEAGQVVATATLSGVTMSAMVGRVRWGMPGTHTGTSVVDYDDLSQNIGSSTALTPPTSANNPPSVTVTANQTVEAGSSVTAKATATDADGSVASYNWSVAYSSATAPVLTDATTAQVTLTAPAAGNLVVLQCVVTDNQGATTTVTTEVRVSTSGEILPLAGTGTGSTWTTVGGASSGGAALADNNDGTYVESPALTSTATTRRYRLAPATTRSALQIKVRHQASTNAVQTAVARLYEGTTLRQGWTLTPGASVTEQVLTVTSPGAIVDWGNLYIEFSSQGE